MNASFRGWGSGIYVAAVLVGPLFASSAHAQSIRIQTGGFGGFQLGINTGPSFGYGSRFGYGAYGYPGYGLGYGVGLPYSSYRYGYPSIYDTYRAQSMYRDYRADYYDRLLNSYRYGIQRDLTYEFPHYESPYRDPVFASPYGDSLYQPPVVPTEPFFDLRDQVIVAPEAAPVVPTASLPESLRAAATRLSASLSRRGNDGDIWLDYLAPGKIVKAIDQGLPADSLRELMRSYDGVVGNPELRSVSSADGFAQTRRLLHQWVETAGVASEPQVGRTRNLEPTKSEQRGAGDAGPSFEEVPAEESILDDPAPAGVESDDAENADQVPAAPAPPKVRVSV
jgi:hypothetical protein